MLVEYLDDDDDDDDDSEKCVATVLKLYDVHCAWTLYLETKTLFLTQSLCFYHKKTTVSGTKKPRFCVTNSA